VACCCKTRAVALLEINMREQKLQALEKEECKIVYLRNCMQRHREVASLKKGSKVPRKLAKQIGKGLPYMKMACKDTEVTLDVQIPIQSYQTTEETSR